MLRGSGIYSFPQAGSRKDRGENDGLLTVRINYPSGAGFGIRLAILLSAQRPEIVFLSPKFPSNIARQFKRRLH